jgi:hypothetical protein
VPIYAWPGLHQRAGRKAPAATVTVAPLLRRGAMAVAAGRVALGLTALAWPVVPARPWVGAAADDLAVRVFGRALGARDLALGAGRGGGIAAPGWRPRVSQHVGRCRCLVGRAGCGREPAVVARPAAHGPVADRRIRWRRGVDRRRWSMGRAVGAGRRVHLR